MLINCDIGERGVHHLIDDQLIGLIDIANIACGGHAGDKESIEYYSALARQNKLEMTAHLSYPDKPNFGRIKININTLDLLNSLYEQYKSFPIGKVKFHGALYHEANNNENLAKELAQWLAQLNVNSIIAPEGSYLIQYANEKGITILYEGFVERGYYFNGKQLELIARGNHGAIIENIAVAVAQGKMLKAQQIVVNKEIHPIRVDTICIHSDSKIALDLAKALHEQL